MVSERRGAGTQHGRWMIEQARVLAATNTDLGRWVRIRVLYPAGSLRGLAGGFSHALHGYIEGEIDERE